MKIVNKEEFEQITKNGVTLVDFFATWCGPCRMMAGILEEAGKELDGKANVIKVDVDEEDMLARSFGIMSIPTLMVFKNGQPCPQEQYDAKCTCQDQQGCPDSKQI